MGYHNSFTSCIDKKDKVASKLLFSRTNLELKVNEIYELSSCGKDAQIKGAKQLEGSVDPSSL